MEKSRDYTKLLLRIASNIKRLRKAFGYTQEDMVNKGFNYRYYQKLESGSYSPNLQTLHRLAHTFKVDVSEFFIK